MTHSLGTRLATFVVIGLVSVGAAGACGSDRAAFEDDKGGGLGGSGDSPTDPFGESKADASTDENTPTRLGWVSGKVTAPEGTVPIRGALVYLTSTPPPAIPDGVHCDTCVTLTPYNGYAYSKSDGTFDVPVYTTGKQYLVTQKGQFRRVREIDAVAGDQTVAGELTRLPPKTDPGAGDTIPKIAMVVGGFDHIDLSLKKLGVAEFDRYGDGPITMGAWAGTKTGKTMAALTQNVAELSKYHIVLMPCAALGMSDKDNGGFLCGTPGSGQKAAFSQYVDAGGKLYVTDFAYETVRQTWPNFITWYSDTDQPLDDTSKGWGTACRAGAENTPGEAKDPGLSDWLTTIGDPTPELKASWTRIQKVTPQPGLDPAGNPTTITPKVWMTSKTSKGELPATVSFEQKCGRVLFSTYHCEGDTADSQLLAQEKALLYILLEVGVCVGELPPPPPPK